MANIKKSELNFLEHLYQRISSRMGFYAEADCLRKLLDGLNEQDAKRNERTRQYVGEKRKSDPCYGRSQKEKDYITKKLKEQANQKIND